MRSLMMNNKRYLEEWKSEELFFMWSLWRQKLNIDTKFHRIKEKQLMNIRHWLLNEIETKKIVKKKKIEKLPRHVYFPEWDKNFRYFNWKVIKRCNEKSGIISMTRSICHKLNSSKCFEKWLCKPQETMCPNFQYK